ncbi:MAG: hypothetical protein ACOCP1_03825, partial [Campylobacterales bacterium]
MKLLLINLNPIVKKLVSLSTQKAGVESEIVQGEDAIQSYDYDYIFVDDELASNELLDKIRQNSSAKVGIFCAKDKEIPEGYDISIKKPFLPTELVQMLSSDSSEDT